MPARKEEGRRTSGQHSKALQELELVLKGFPEGGWSQRSRSRSSLRGLVSITIPKPTHSNLPQTQLWAL